MNDQPNYYDSNMDLLKSHHPDLWETMTSNPPYPIGELCLTACGKPNLKIDCGDGKAILLHNNDALEAEIESYLDYVYPDATGAVILMGMGLGHVPLAILKSRPYLKDLVIFEAIPGIFTRALQTMDLTPLLSDLRVTLIIDPTPDVDTILNKKRRTIQLDHSHLLRHLNSFQVDNQTYMELNDKVYAHISSLNVAAMTVQIRGHEFIEKRFANLTAMHHNYHIGQLAGAFTNIPAILVAGGPSLDLNIHHLKKAEGKALIFAVDSVLPVLLKNGITPDFVSCIDPNDLTYEKIAGSLPELPRGISLICTPPATPKVPKFFPADHVFWVFCTTFMDLWIGQLAGCDLVTSEIQTVAHLNLAAAHIMGASPIIFMGQDLAFTTGNDHAAHTVLNKNDEMQKILRGEGDCVWVEGINGDKVPTSRSFLSMLRLFEEKLTNTPDGHFINATAAGAKIKGAEHLAIDEAIARHCQTEHNVQATVELCTQKGPHAKPQLLQNLLAELRLVLSDIRLLRKTNTSAEKLTQSTLENVRHIVLPESYCNCASLPIDLQKNFVEIDRLNAIIDDKNKVWQLAHEITLSYLQESEHMKQKLEYLSGDPEKFIEKCEKNLTRLTYIDGKRELVMNILEQEISKLLSHLKSESKLRKLCKQKNAKPTDRLKLARLYFKSNDLVLMEPWLEKLQNDVPDSSEILFYLGCIAAHRTEYKKQEAFFSRALAIDPNIEERIEDFRQQLGNEYFTHGDYFRTKDQNTFKKLLIKGLNYCPNHQVILKELQAAAAKDLLTIDLLIKDRNFVDARSPIKAWEQYLNESKALTSCLPARQVAEFYRYSGNLLTEEQAFDKALAMFQKALCLVPDDPEYCIYLTDTYFSMGEYAQGISYLRQAITIDKKYAQYWENIGDNLQSAGNYLDAVSAYEQCFQVLPEKTGLLKKIGDCCLAASKAGKGQESVTMPQTCATPAKEEGVQ